MNVKVFIALGPRRKDRVGVKSAKAKNDAIKCRKKDRRESFFSSSNAQNMISFSLFFRLSIVRPYRRFGGIDDPRNYK
jgi:hypothetical protein